MMFTLESIDGILIAPLKISTWLEINENSTVEVFHLNEKNMANVIL